MSNPTPTNVDWRKPLYDYAQSTGFRYNAYNYPEIRDILTRLGDYQDCPVRLMNLNQKMEESYQEAVNDIESNDEFSLSRAIDTFKSMAAFRATGDELARAEAALAALKEKQRLEQEENDRRAARKKRLTAIILSSAAAAAVLAIVIYTMIVPPKHLKAGDALLAEGKYAESVAEYEQGAFLWHISNSEAGALNARKLWAEELITQESYEDAISIYEQIGDEESANHVRLRWGDALFDSGAYADAINIYELLGEIDTVNDAYRKWSDELAANGDPAQAIEKLLQTPDNDVRSARLEELRQQEFDKAIADASTGTLPVEVASVKGAKFTDLDQQLLYCRTLYEAGYDLMLVYPDGVNVEIADIGTYQPYAYNSYEEEYLCPSLESFLLFERRQIRPSEFASIMSKDSGAEASYTVKLLPGQMYAWIPENVADSWDEAESIVLLDCTYMRTGSLIEETKTTSGNRTIQTTEREIPFYAAVDNITAYEKDDPSHFYVCAAETYDPACASDEWIDKHNKSSSSFGVSVNDRFGESNLESMYEELDSCLTLMYLIGLEFIV